MPAQEVARRVISQAARAWRQIPEPWRQSLFEKAPAATTAAARLKDWRGTYTRVVPVARMPGAARPNPEPETGPAFKLRAQDVRSGYRLLLYRDPSPTELEHHVGRGATDSGYNLYRFADGLLAGAERTEAIARINQPEQATLDGLIFHYRPVDTTGGALIAYQGVYEREVGRVIDRRLPKGGVYVDIGTGIGLHALRGARAVGPEGRVLAWETEPDNVELVSLSGVVNGFDQLTVQLLTLDGSDLDPDPVRPNLLRLDLVRLDLVHLDCGDTEPDAFTSMTQAVEQFRPPMIIRLDPDALRRSVDSGTAGYLQALTGYRFGPIVDGADKRSSVDTIEALVALLAGHGTAPVTILAEPS